MKGTIKITPETRYVLVLLRVSTVIVKGRRKLHYRHLELVKPENTHHGGGETAESKQNKQVVSRTVIR